MPDDLIAFPVSYRPLPPPEEERTARAPKFSDITADPDFQSLDPSEQFKVRKGFFQKIVAVDPEYRALPTDERFKATKAFLFPEAGKEESFFGKLKSGAAFEGPVGQATLKGLEAVQAGIRGLPSTAATMATDIGKAAITPPEEGLFTPVSPSTSIKRLKDVLQGLASGATAGIYEPAPAETEAQAARRIGGTVGGFALPFTAVTKGAKALGAAAPVAELIAGGVTGAAKPLAEGKPLEAVEQAVTGAGLVGAFQLSRVAFKRIYGREPANTAEIQEAAKEPAFVEELGKAAEELTPDQAVRAQAIDSELTRLENLRQSQRGGQLLRRELVAEEARSKRLTPETPIEELISREEPAPEPTAAQRSVSDLLAQAQEQLQPKIARGNKTLEAAFDTLLGKETSEAIANRAQRRGMIERATPSIDEIVADPDYRALPLEQQTTVKQTFLDKVVAKDPRYLALDENGKAAVDRTIVETEPPAVPAALEAAKLTPETPVADLFKKNRETGRAPAAAPAALPEVAELRRALTEAEAPPVRKIGGKTFKEAPAQTFAELARDRLALPEDEYANAQRSPFNVGFRMKDGEIISGSRGQTHGDLYNALTPAQIRAGEPESGYVIPGTKTFITGDQAAALRGPKENLARVAGFSEEIAPRTPEEAVRETEFLRIGKDYLRRGEKPAGIPESPLSPAERSMLQRSFTPKGPKPRGVEAPEPVTPSTGLGELRERALREKGYSPEQIATMSRVDADLAIRGKSSKEPAPAEAAQAKAAPLTPSEAKVQTPAEFSKASIGDLLREGFGSETGSIGQLTPEQLATEQRARAARQELYRRASEKAAETGKSIDEAARELGVPSAMASRIARAQRVDAAADGIRQTVSALEGLNERARVTIPEAETVRETGTLSKQAREPFREETGAKPQTFNWKFSEAEIRQGQQAIVDTARKLQTVVADLQVKGDPLSANVARLAEASLQKVLKETNEAADLFRKQRFAAGRAVRAYNKPPIPADVIETLKSVGVTIEGLTNAKQKLPIYTNIVRSLKNFKDLQPAERTQLWRDFVDAFRLNLFSVTSWSLDLIGNLSELGAQAVGGAGRDLVHLAKGEPTFPSLQGAMRAIRERKALPPEIAEELGVSIGGEKILGGFGKGPGTFTLRETLPSKSLDYLVGTPLYTKGLFDRAARSFSANATLWREAIEAADKAELKGSDRRAFYEKFWEHPPQEAINTAITEGKKAAFDRVLTRFEESVGRSVTARLFVDAFARWPFQFSRWAGEMVGYNPEIYRKLRAGTATPEDIGGYLTKTATGIGGLYLLDQMLYDKTDFNSMEYVHDDGNRTRLSGREPIATALFFLALIKGDVDKATGVLRYASVPFAKLLIGEGGLLGSLIKQTDTAIKNADVDPKALGREWTDTLNRAIPGQAILSAVKTVFDPVMREGVGANLPIISLFNPPAISPTTGEPLELRQKILGVEIPAIGGSPIPGAQRILDPTSQLLSRYGLFVYRGPRTPIAGYPAGDVPDEVSREWRERFGKRRAVVFEKLVPLIERVESERQDEIFPGSPVYENLRKTIQTVDSRIAKAVTAELNREYGTPGRLPRQPSAKERRQPTRGADRSIREFFPTAEAETR